MAGLEPATEGNNCNAKTRLSKAVADWATHADRGATPGDGNGDKDTGHGGNPNTDEHKPASSAPRHGHGAAGSYGKPRHPDQAGSNWGSYNCAYFDEPNQRAPHQPADKQSYGVDGRGGIELSKRYPPQDLDSDDDGQIVYDRASRTGKVIFGPVHSNNTISCGGGSYCFTLWASDRRNKSQTYIQKQGCWLTPDGDACAGEPCVAIQRLGHNNFHICCCQGHMCNTRFRDGYNSSKQRPSVTSDGTTTDSALKAVGLIQGNSYLVETIGIALGLFLSVSLITVLSYLVYRLCMTSKRATPLSSSAGTRTDTDLQDIGPGKGPAHFDINNLKILDLIVRGRYSEVRKGLLDGKDVAVKIYQHHHRQYFFNEWTAFALPFMENKNLVKFYGAAERPKEDGRGDGVPDTELEMGLGNDAPDQYMVVTELATLGSLTGYLKNNTLDWYRLCHMCQDICQGLVHLHTDVTCGGLFKPAIVHRDINTRNILVKADLTCVLADLGFALGVMGSKIFRNGVAEIAEQSSLADVGTLRYMAPEVFDGAVNLRDCEASLKQIDVYALGLVMWEIATRCVDLYQGAAVPEYQLPYQAEAGNHPLFEELQVLVVKYKTRPKFPEVWKDTHPAVRSLKETIEDCWDPDAEARLTALCVQERVVDISTLWLQGSNRKREVMPTLNTDLRPSVSRASSIPGVVSNGMSVLLSFVDDGSAQDGGSFTRAGLVGSSHRPASAEGYGGTVAEDGVEATVTTPLIDRNVNHLPAEEDSLSEDRKRVRAWLQDQSVSGSTVDTLLPLTPLGDQNQNLMDCHRDKYSCPQQGNNQGHQTQAASPLWPGQGQANVKANNVLLAQSHGVIYHPNQGRNPTVERNTHKCSDEELAVQGNQLVGAQDSQSSAGSETLGPLAKRKGSDTQSAPCQARVVTSGGRVDSLEGNVEGLDSAGELSSLVQHDLLNDTHSQQLHSLQPQRNAPIPYLQNQVHGEIDVPSCRPKLANISVKNNRYSYSHPHKENENEASTGGRGLILSYPQYGSNNPSLADKRNTFETKSLKNVFSKFIRPKDLGHKVSMMVFGAGKKQKSELKNYDKAAGGDVSLALAGHYENSGLEASPQSRSGIASGEKPQMTSSGPAVPMQVELRNGTTVSSTCKLPNVNGGTPAPNHSRLSATDVRQGAFKDSSGGRNSQSASLFAGHPGERRCSPREGEGIPSAVAHKLVATTAAADDDSSNQGRPLLQKSGKPSENPFPKANVHCSNRDGGGEEQDQSGMMCSSAPPGGGGFTSSAPLSKDLPKHHQLPLADVLGSESTQLPAEIISQGKKLTALDQNFTSPGVSNVDKPCKHQNRLKTDQPFCDKAERPMCQNAGAMSANPGHLSDSKADNQDEKHGAGYAALAPGSFYVPDTKGGNSCMYSIKTSSSSVVPDRVVGPSLAGVSQQQGETSSKAKPLYADSASSDVSLRGSGGRKVGNSVDLDNQSSPRHVKDDKHLDRLSESRNSRDLRKLHSDYCNGQSMNGLSPELFAAGMSQSWHEDGARPNSNSYLHHRPKSLSLKGHNYKQKQQPQAAATGVTQEEMSFPSSAGDSSSLSRAGKMGIQRDNDPFVACEVKDNNNTVKHSDTLNAPGKPKVENGNITGFDGLASISSIPVVAPNVAISASLDATDLKMKDNIAHRQIVPPLCVSPAGVVADSSLPLAVSPGGRSFKPIDAPAAHSPDAVRKAHEKKDSTKLVSLSASQSSGHLKLKSSPADLGQSDELILHSKAVKNLQISNRHGNNQSLSNHHDANGDENDKEGSRHKGAKIRRSGSTSSDSSEKIRRRIKTPVSFKNGRLSLYDDRLMSHSLDSALLFSAAGEEV
ncbi:receptor protein serine/threonine kinase [Plakobranchus ocellatus]|uniref:Serine/threonine-protein kinase receptor n=1 Tax=Plakobranchus ocellatus TaxID=259542 RepID=A0AAV4BM00_9GAST|nr:receptor protein serine/threonine kinase [Plakobranchus ocellatus]